MRLRLPTALVAAGLALAACSAETETPEAPSETTAAASDQGLPVETLPETQRTDWTECPYLDTEWVAQTNGQRVTGVGIDSRFDTPACQFWSYPEEPQLTVIVRHMASPQESMAVVDWATPVSYTHLTLPTKA